MISFEQTIKYIKKYKWEISVCVAIIILILCRIIYGKNEYTHQQEYDIYTQFKTVNKPKKRVNNKHEKECRRIVESLFNKSFHSMKPDFLEFENGANLELDMYNEELKLAFEYQGVQHSKYNSYFHKKYEDYLYQLRKDEFKRKKCKELNITLIEIPHTVKFEKLKEYIISELLKHNITVKNN